MKFSLIIDTKKEEEVVVYAHQKSELTNEMEALVNNYGKSINGYKEDEIIKLNLNEVYCFFAESSRVYAYTKEEKLQIRLRLYEVEQTSNESFVRINKSCIVNVRQIKKFSSSFNGALMVELKNGYQDFVSRRELRNVKERLGL